MNKETLAVIGSLAFVGFVVSVIPALIKYAVIGLIVVGAVAFIRSAFK